MSRHYLSWSGQVWIVLVALFLWLPFLDAYFMGFTYFWQAGLQAVESFLSDRALRLFGNTMVIGAGTALASLALGLPLGYYLGQGAYEKQKFWIYGCLVPLLIPPYITAMVWSDLFSAKGVLNSFLMSVLRLDAPPVNVLGLGGAIFVLTLSYFPYLILFVLSAILSMDPSLEEAGRLSMAPRRVFWRITLPFIKPYLVAGGLIVFVFATANYGVPAFLGVLTYPVETFAEFSAFFNSSQAIITSWPLLCLVSGFMIWHWHLMRQRDLTILSPQSFLRQASKIAHPYLISSFLSVVLALAVAVPLIWILWVSASWRIYGLAMQTAWHPMLTTLLLAASTATLAVLLCYPAAYLIVRTKSWGSAFLDLFSFLPLAIPGTILGLGLIRVWNHPRTDFIYGSAAILLLGYLAQFSSFSLRCLVPTLRQISPQLEDSYLLHHPGWFRRQKNIVCPLARTGIKVAWILVFVLSLGELGATVLVMPAGMETLSLRISNLMHYGAYDLVAALSAILLGFALLPLMLLFWKRTEMTKT